MLTGFMYSVKATWYWCFVSQSMPRPSAQGHGPEHFSSTMACIISIANNTPSRGISMCGKIEWDLGSL